MRGRKHHRIRYETILIYLQIKKESPNEGTETDEVVTALALTLDDKKRIPE